MPRSVHGEGHTIGYEVPSDGVESWGEEAVNAVQPRPDTEQQVCGGGVAGVKGETGNWRS